MKKKTLRKRVYMAIDQEREYQDLKRRGDDPALSVMEYLSYIQCHGLEAMHGLVHGPRFTAIPSALHFLREIAACAVEAMEQHGAPYRPGADLEKLR